MEVLIERDGELKALAEVVGAAVAGRGGAVLVEGEAGIGNTRLLALARAGAADTGARVLYAIADESEAGVPLAAARVLLARAARGVARDGPALLGVLALEGALADPTGPGSRADEVAHALWWLILELADERPLALFVDDAQWADDVTIGLLRTVARRAGELPLALVVASRPPAVLAAERAFVRLQLAPLSIDGTARLMEAVLGRPGSEALVARARAITAAGNPLYLSELLQDARVRGVDPMSDGRAPPQLVRLVRHRLERVGPAAAALARAIAVLGADAAPRRARALAGLAPSDGMVAEEELRGERVLVADAYAFAHPLLAAAAREGIGALKAAELHARAAALMAADGVEDSRVAEHLMRAPPRGDPEVVQTLRRAAEAARRLGALASAARLLDRAMDEPPPPPLADTVALEHGRAMLDGGEQHGERVLMGVARRAAVGSVRCVRRRRATWPAATGWTAAPRRPWRCCARSLPDWITASASCG